MGHSEPTGVGRCPAQGCSFTTATMPPTEALHAVLDHLHVAHELAEAAGVHEALLLPVSREVAAKRLASRGRN